MRRPSIHFIFTLIILASCKEPVPGSNVEPCDLDISKSTAMGYDLDRSIATSETSEPQEAPQRDCKIPAKEPSASLDFQVQLTDFNEEQAAKMRDALRRARIVLNSQAFKEKVLGHTHNGERTFVENNGQSNEEIYDTIMAGAETLLPEVDNEMDLDITLYYRNNSTVGYTYPDTTRIWVNDKFFSGYTLGQVANNAVHEWTHKLGYGHSYYNNADRPYSVPYAIGEIIEELVDGM